MSQYGARENEKRGYERTNTNHKTCMKTSLISYALIISIYCINLFSIVFPEEYLLSIQLSTKFNIFTYIFPHFCLSLTKYAKTE